jgi:two-component system CheB/CheR fusion protein
MTQDASDLMSLQKENAELRSRIEIAEETLSAIRGGEVDALVIGDQVYTLESADAASNRFRGEVLAQINEVVIAIDNDSRVTYLNPAAERQYQVSASEILGRKLEELYRHDWPNPHLEPIAMDAIREKGSWRGENIHIKRSGEIIHVESTVTALKDRNGNVSGLLAVIRDISDRRAADDALRQAHDDLEARVLERTLELSDANVALLNEMAERSAAEKQRAELLQKVVTSQEDERRRIARDIHDQLGQRVTGLRLQIASICDVIARGQPVSDQMTVLMETAEKLDTDVSFLAWELRPSSLDDLGLVQALTEFINEWSHHYKIPVDFINRGFSRERLTTAAETHFYRIMQESLNNVAKHSQATRVNILLESSGDQVTMIIEDNGIGFDRDEQKILRDNRSLGLLGMKERAILIGGTVEIESTHGSGTTIYVRAPAVSAEGMAS